MGYQNRKSKELSAGLTHLSLVVKKELTMAPVVDPGLTCCSLALGNFIGVVHRNCVDATAMDIEMLSQILHAHGRALNVPSWISSTPWRIPHHCLFSELAVGEPEDEILRIALVAVHHDPGSAELILLLLACKLSIVINGVDGEIYISSGSIGVALLLQSLDKGDHILDVVCSLTYHLRSFNVQRLLVSKESISIELGYIPYALSCLTASLSKLVLSIISVSCKVTNIGDVHYMLYTISCFLKSLVKDIFKDECSEVSDMRIVVDCRSATVHTDLSFFNRYEILHLAVHCVIQLHAKYLLPVINTVLAIIDNFPIS